MLHVNKICKMRLLIRPYLYLQNQGEFKKTPLVQREAHGGARQAERDADKTNHLSFRSNSRFLDGWQPISDPGTP